MTFLEWWEKFWLFSDCDLEAEAAWDFQQARIDELKKAFNEVEASSIGPVTRMRETGRITIGYKEFCALAALQEESNDNG